MGSTGYVEGLSAADRKKIKLYLNVDMVASPNGGYFVQGGKGDDPRRPLDPRARPRSGRCLPTSWPRPAWPTRKIIEFVGDDESPFIEAGIPVGGGENGDAQEDGQAGQGLGRAGRPSL